MGDCGERILRMPSAPDLIEEGNMAQTQRRAFLPPRWFIRAAWVIHRALYRLSGGRFGLRKPTPKTYGTMTIHTTGRRSGARQTAILVFEPRH
jgi:hypothetical protein